MSRPIDRSVNEGSLLDDPHILSGPFWGELRVFLAVAKAKSFNRAADELAMSQPTVSRQVRRLQDVMGTQLVIPTQSGIRLTRQGEELAKSLLDLDQKLFEIANVITAEARTAEGLVHVTAGEALTGTFVAPALAAFGERYPKIRLQFRTPANLSDFRGSQSDIMLAIAPSDDPAVTTRTLGFMHMLPIASRQYIARYGVPTRSNLAAHCFLQLEYYAAGDEVWAPWSALLARGVVTYACDNSYSYGLMVKSGLGIGLLSNYALSDPAAIPLELGAHIRVPLYALAVTERLKAQPVRLVYDWICELFDASAPWFGPDLKLDLLPREALSPLLAQLLAGPEQIP